MRDRRQLVQHAGIVDEDIQPPEAFHDGGAEQVQLLLLLLQVEGQQGGAAAGGGADRVIRLLQPALGARDQHAMRAEGGEFDGECRADAARRPGHQGDAILQGKLCHGWAPCSRECGGSAFSRWSTREIA